MEKSKRKTDYNLMLDRSLIVSSGKYKDLKVSLCKKIASKFKNRDEAYEYMLSIGIPDYEAQAIVIIGRHANIEFVHIVAEELGIDSEAA